MSHQEQRVWNLLHLPSDRGTVKEAVQVSRHDPRLSILVDRHSARPLICIVCLALDMVEDWAGAHPMPSSRSSRSGSSDAHSPCQTGAVASTCGMRLDLQRHTVHSWACWRYCLPFKDYHAEVLPLTAPARTRSCVASGRCSIQVDARTRFATTSRRRGAIWDDA